MAINKIKWGPISLLGIVLFLIFFVLLKIIENERKVLSSEEIKKIAHVQYTLEKNDRLYDLRVMEDRLQRLESLTCELGEDNISLKKTVGSLESQLCVLRNANKPNALSPGPYGGRGRVSESTGDRVQQSPITYVEVNGKKYRKTPYATPGNIALQGEMHKIESMIGLTKSMNKVDPHQMATYKRDPRGGHNILYFNTRLRMFTYLYPVARLAVAEPVVTSKKTSAKKQTQVTKGSVKQSKVVSQQNSLPQKIRG